MTVFTAESFISSLLLWAGKLCAGEAHNPLDAGVVAP